MDVYALAFGDRLRRRRSSTSVSSVGELSSTSTYASTYAESVMPVPDRDAHRPPPPGPRWPWAFPPRRSPGGKGRPKGGKGAPKGGKGGRGKGMPRAAALPQPDPYPQAYTPKPPAPAPPAFPSPMRQPVPPPVPPPQWPHTQAPGCMVHDPYNWWWPLHPPPADSQRICHYEDAGYCHCEYGHNTDDGQWGGQWLC